MGCCGGGHQNHHNTRSQSKHEPETYQEKSGFAAYVPMLLVLGIGLAVLYFFK
ncbi:hypothetical protein [Anaerosolibacter sp.]|uniref:hypothetical protein n=1 Tax=Anaerosolibacter sp. TaxID=1872527 RepID=UPI0039F01972